jgi:hypothetical protein
MKTLNKKIYSSLVTLLNYFRTFGKSSLHDGNCAQPVVVSGLFDGNSFNGEMSPPFGGNPFNGGI